MIIRDLSEEAVVRSVRDWLDQSQAKEKKDRIRSMNYYEGINLKNDVDEFFDSKALEYAPAWEQNITRKIINARFVAYKEKAQRKADEKYLELLGDLDHDLLQLDRLTGLLGSVAYLRGYDENEQRLTGQVLVDFEPLFKPASDKVEGVMYPLYNYGKNRADEQVWVFWSDDLHFKITTGGKVIPVSEDGDISNPYGKNPVIISHLYDQIGNEWWRTGVGKEVANANLLYNVFGTMLSIGCMYQSLSQPVATGIDDPTRIRVGADKLITMPPNSTFDFKSPSGDLNKIMDSMRWVADTVAFANHLKIKWADNSGSTSGEHQRVLEVELTEAVQSDFERLRSLEAERFEVDKKILEAYNIKIKDEMSVSFSAPHIPLSQSEEQAEWEWKWANGLATKADWFRVNEGLSDEEIQGRLGEVREEKKVTNTKPSLLSALQSE